MSGDLFADRTSTAAMNWTDGVSPRPSTNPSGYARLFAHSRLFIGTNLNDPIPPCGHDPAGSQR